MTRFNCTDIKWDTDGVQILDLPTTVLIDVDLDEDDTEDEHEDQVVNALSDKYGWCIFGLSIQRCHGEDE
jgi:hypothetical protein